MKAIQRVFLENAMIYYNEHVIKQLPEGTQKDNFKELWQECWAIISALE